MRIRIKKLPQQHELNAKKWKHDLGGNLFSGEDTPTQQMSSGLNLYRNTNKAGDVWYTYQETPDSEEILLTPTNKRFSDDPTNWDYKDASGREYSPRMTTTYNPGEIREDTRGPLERMVDNYFGELKYQVNNNVPISGKYTMPAIAAAPFLAWAGEAAYPYVSAALANPYVDAGLTSAFAGHGLNHAINEGIDGWGDAAMTALELAPLGRLAKPILNEAALAVENYRYPLGRPQVPEGYITIKPQVRTRVGDIEIDNPQLAYRQGEGIVDDFIKRGVVEAAPPSESNIVTTRGGLTFDFTPQRFDLPMFSQGRPWYGIGKPKSKEMLVTAESLSKSNSNGGLEPWKYNGTFDIRYDLGKPHTPGWLRRVPDDEQVLNTSNTSAYKWEPGYGYRRVFTEETPTTDWPMSRTASQITAENAASITPEQWTAAQDAAIARGGMVEAQRLRDLHFNTKSSGSDASKILYNHSTDSEPFYSFDLDRPTNHAGSARNGKGVYIEPLINLSEEPDMATWGRNYQGDWGSNNLKLRINYENPEIPIVDNPISTHPEGYVGRVEAFVRDPRKIKLDDAVTYDDKGVRIPLGERDNFNINDIRYGLLPFGIGLTGYGLWQRN